MDTEEAGRNIDEILETSELFAGSSTGISLMLLFLSVSYFSICMCALRISFLKTRKIDYEAKVKIFKLIFFVWLMCLVAFTAFILKNKFYMPSYL